MSKTKYQHKNNASTQDQHLDDSNLWEYLEGNLDANAQRAMEELLHNEQPEAEALEGLQMISPYEAKKSVAQLQKKLHQQILKKNKKASTHKNVDFWGWISLILILLLISIGYFVIRISSH